MVKLRQASGIDIGRTFIKFALFNETLKLIKNVKKKILHGFDSVEHLEAYLTNEMFQKDILCG